MTSKHVIRESESPRPAASSILISQMTRSSVIIPYFILMTVYRFLTRGRLCYESAHQLFYERIDQELCRVQKEFFTIKSKRVSLSFVQTPHYFPQITSYCLAFKIDNNRGTWPFMTQKIPKPSTLVIFDQLMRSSLVIFH